jgi:hypothetical protein
MLRRNLSQLYSEASRATARRKTLASSAPSGNICSHPTIQDADIEQMADAQFEALV